MYFTHIVTGHSPLEDLAVPGRLELELGVQAIQYTRSTCQLGSCAGPTILDVIDQLVCCSFTNLQNDGVMQPCTYGPLREREREIHYIVPANKAD